MLLSTNAKDNPVIPTKRKSKPLIISSLDFFYALNWRRSCVAPCYLVLSTSVAFSPYLYTLPLGWVRRSVSCPPSVGMVAHVIVGHEHEYLGAMLRVAQTVVVHSLVAAAVSKRQHGLLAYLAVYLQHLVGF